MQMIEITQAAVQQLFTFDVYTFFTDEHAVVHIKTRAKAGTASSESEVRSVYRGMQISCCMSALCTSYSYNLQLLQPAKNPKLYLILILSLLCKFSSHL